MRLEHAHIENFKLLETSSSTSRPIVKPRWIRAENGSGKTSLLYALLWAFYGSYGLPPARKVPLGRHTSPANHRHSG